jgi:hypothetical protein
MASTTHQIKIHLPLKVKNEGGEVSRWLKEIRESLNSPEGSPFSLRVDCRGGLERIPTKKRS